MWLKTGIFDVMTSSGFSRMVRAYSATRGSLRFLASKWSRISVQRSAKPIRPRPSNGPASPSVLAMPSTVRMRFWCRMRLSWLGPTTLEKYWKNSGLTIWRSPRSTHPRFENTVSRQVTGVPHFVHSVPS